MQTLSRPTRRPTQTDPSPPLVSHIAAAARTLPLPRRRPRSPGLLPPTPSLPTPGPRSSSRRDPGCASQPPRPGDGEPTTRTAWHPDGLCGEEEEEAGRQEEGFPPHVLDPRRRQPRSGGRLLLYGRCSAGGGGVRGRSLNPPSSSKIASSKPDGRQIAAPTPWRCTRETTPTPPALLLRRWPILPPLRHRWSGA